MASYLPLQNKSGYEGKEVILCRKGFPGYEQALEDHLLRFR